MTTTVAPTIIATDKAGTWTGHLVQRCSDGWHFLKITQAPASMNHCTGAIIGFPSYEIAQ